MERAWALGMDERHTGVVLPSRLHYRRCTAAWAKGKNTHIFVSLSVAVCRCFSVILLFFSLFSFHLANDIHQSNPGAIVCMQTTTWAPLWSHSHWMAKATALKFISYNADESRVLRTPKSRFCRPRFGRPKHSISIKNENNPTYRAESARENLLEMKINTGPECGEPSAISIERERMREEQTKPSNRILLFSIRFEWQNGITCYRGAENGTKKMEKFSLRQESGSVGDGECGGKRIIRMSRYQVASLRCFDRLKTKMEQEMSVK